MARRGDDGALSAWWLRYVLGGAAATALALLAMSWQGSPSRASVTVSTSVCGALPAGTTTWNHAGSPYGMCSGGITVGPGSTLVVDASAGSVEVAATGVGGIAVNGGSLATAGTSASSTVAFESVQAGGTWYGISATADATSGAKGAISLSYTSVSGIYGDALTISSGATSSPDDPTVGLSLSNVTVSNVSGSGVNATQTPVRVADSTFTGIGAKGIYVSSNADISITGNKIGATPKEGIDVTPFNHAVTVSGNTVTGSNSSTPGEAAIIVNAFGSGTRTVTDNTVNGGHKMGIEVWGGGNLAFTGNAVNGTGTGASPYPAVYLNGVTADLATGVSGNHGSGNGLDAIAFAGTATSDWSWLTPTNSASDHAFGYLLSGAVTVQSGKTLTVHPGDVVKQLTGGIALQGATLDGSDSTGAAKTFTGFHDTTVGLPTCPSALAPTNCTSTYQDWAGISGGEDTSRAAVRLANTVLRNVSGSAVSITSNTMVPGAALGASFDHVTVSNVAGAAISTSNTPTSVTSSTLTGVDGGIFTGGAPLTATGNAITSAKYDGIVGSSATGAVTITENTVTSSNRGNGASPGAYAGTAAILASGAGTSSTVITVSGNSVSGGGRVGIEVDRATHPVVTDNTITGSGASDPFVGYPAVYLDQDTVGLATGVAGNHGSGNDYDAIVLSGTVDSDLVWRTAARSSTDNPFGYLVGGPLTVTAGRTMTVHQGDVVKTFAGGISLQGATLDASDTTGPNAPKVFTSWRDSSAGLPMCNAWLFQNATCPDPSRPYPIPPDWTGISATQGASITMVNGDVRNASISGVSASGSALHVLSSSFTHGTGYGVTAVSAAAGSIVDCSTVHGNLGGVQDDGSAAVTDSDLYGNATAAPSYDLLGTGTAPASAQRTWWGQAGGPTSSPAQYSGLVDFGNALDSQAPTVASIVVINAASTPSDTTTIRPGANTVTVTYSRHMSTTVQPTVTLTDGSNPAIALSGSWTSATSWVASYAQPDVAAPPSDQTISAGGARSCVPDAASSAQGAAGTQAVTVVSSSDTSAPVLDLTAEHPSPTSSNTNTLTFSATDTDSPSGVALTCALDGLAQSSCTSPYPTPALADGEHAFDVTATDPSGNTGSAHITWDVDTTAPAVSLSSRPLAFSNSTGAAFGFTVTDSTAGDVLTPWCALDGATPAACTTSTSQVYAALVQGSHTFSVVAKDAAGNVSQAASATWVVDTAVPAAALTAPATTTPVALAGSVTVRWAGSDPGSGISYYRVQVRRARWDGGFSTWSTPTSWSHLTSSSLTSTGLLRGYNYCYRVIAVDRASNASVPSAARCDEVPLDSTSLSAVTAGWMIARSTSLWNGSALQTRTLGATLRMPGVAQLNRVGLVATTCATCGKVGVYVNGHLAATINLASTSTHLRQIRLTPVLSYRTGTVTLRVLTSSKLVQVDGLGVTRP